MLKYLDNYQGIDSLKNMSFDDLNGLIKDIEILILKRCETIGGHLATNISNVESVVMLYRHFNPKNGYIVYDTAHEGYTHKILTDRKDVFLNKLKVGTLTTPRESKYDCVGCSHGGVGASYLCGFAKATDKPCVLYVGDGTLTNGTELEGLNQIAMLKRNVVIVVNDNRITIMSSSGGVYKHLNQDFFNSFGLDYIEVKNGYNLKELDKAYDKAFSVNHPIVVHVHTVKGKGYIYSEKNPTKWHFCDEGFNALKGDNHYAEGELLDLLDDVISDIMKKKQNVYAVSTSMPDLGFGEKVQSFKNRYYDVGMAEEHAFVESCGISLAGGYAILGTYSTFSQRMYDMIMTCGTFDNINMTILLHESGVKENNIFQNGMYDISMFNQSPYITELCPVTMNDIISMLYYTTSQKGIYVIRIPNGIDEINNEKLYFDKNSSMQILSSNNTDLIFIGIGKSIYEAKKYSEKYPSTLICSISNQLNTEILDNFKKSKLIVAFEDGIVSGGFGDKINRYFALDDVKVLPVGISNYNYFGNPNDKNIEDIYKENDIDFDSICKKIDSVIK